MHQSAVHRQSASFDKNKYSLSDPTSIWVVVNKNRALPNNYQPADLVVPNVRLAGSALSENMHLRRVTARALEDLFTAAAGQKINLKLGSGFRSQVSQSTLYHSYVVSVGQTEADRASARPGHSEHQTGFAIDVEAADGVCNIQQCFANTAEGKWLATNAYKYGFIIRYPNGKETITGYEYEPWHIRYVGVELSSQMRRTGVLTLEEFFGLN